MLARSLGRHLVAHHAVACRIPRRGLLGHRRHDPEDGEYRNETCVLHDRAPSNVGARRHAADAM
jgi:hypothetical protein